MKISKIKRIELDCCLVWNCVCFWPSIVIYFYFKLTELVRSSDPYQLSLIVTSLYYCWLLSWFMSSLLITFEVFKFFLEGEGTLFWEARTHSKKQEQTHISKLLLFYHGCFITLFLWLFLWVYIYNLLFILFLNHLRVSCKGDDTPYL